MRKRLGDKLTYANVMATLAFFLALGGVGYAATQLPKNSVHSKQIAKGAVKTAKLGKAAVTQAKIKAGAVGSAQIGSGAVGSAQIGVGAVGSAQIGAGAVGTAQIGDGQVTAAKIAPAEPIHYVGTTGEPQFNSNVQRTWTNVGSGNSVGFYKDQLGIVHLLGTALCVDFTSSGNCGISAAAIFTLPAGYRPPLNETFTVPNSTSPAKRIDVTIYPSGPTNPGQVFVLAPSGLDAYNLSLDSISFRGS